MAAISAHFLSQDALRTTKETATLDVSIDSYF